MKIKHCLVLLIVLFVTVKGYSQPCTTLGQTPSTAFPVCGTTNFIQNTVPLCGNTPVPGPCSLDQLTDKNPFWYRFTCYSPGTLGFRIIPNNLGDDYDWQLFDITNRNPNDVFTDPTLFVACNWSGLTGVTGASSAGTSVINCGGNGYPLFSSMPVLIVGHTYLLLISHWTNTQSGYQLSFGGGTAVITDPVIPALQRAYADCAGQQVTLVFNKNMKCNSLAANGTDFIIGPGVIASATGFGCTSSFDMDSALITLNAPLLPGTYTIIAADGSDGNTVLDNCGTPIVAGNSATFTVAPIAPLPMGTVTPPPCAPISLTVTFADPIKCNSVAANGSDFTVTGPAAVTIVSAAAVNCNANGETNSITITLQAPILTSGTYQVNAATGTDGNTLVGQCNRQVTAGTNASFNVSPQAAIAMGSVTPPPCIPQTITLNFAESVNCNSVATNGSDFVITGPSVVTVSGATAVNCDANGQTTSITIQFAAPILTSGSYNVQMSTGTDGNTLTGNCGRQINAGGLAPFTLAPQPPVVMGAVVPPPCTPQTITLNFAEPVNCNSVAANGSDFVITGPSAVTVSGAAAVNCDANGQTTSITIQFAAPILISGSYNVQMSTGTDGNTLTGNCGRQVNAGDLASFTLPPQPAIAMGAVAPPPCTPQTITLNFADPVNCNSIAANGSDFVITGPSAVNIVSAAAGNCDANGQTTNIIVQFATPILATGNFSVQIATGTDGNTLTGQCGRQVTAGSNTTFTLAPQPPLPLGTLSAVSCSPSSVTLNFTDPLDCTSISPNGSEFIITGPSAVTVTAANGQCNINPNLRTITIQFAAPIIVSGTYRLQIQTGSDGNTLRGDCNRYVAAGDFTTFTIPPAFPVPMDSIVPVACSPSSLKLIFGSPIRCSSIASNGSDFIINGPSAAVVASASGTCDANGLTTSINIQLASPIVTGGLYTVQLVSGSDGNTLLSDCNRPTPAGSSLNFTASDTVSAEFQTQMRYGCEQDTITFSHDGQHNVNQWTWTVNGAAAGNAQTFTKVFSAASQNQVQLVVSNGVCSDTYSAPVVLNNKVVVGFTLPESVCPEDTVVFKNTSTGGIDSWQWTFGNGNTSNVQNPAAQVYPLTGIEKLYTVSLTAGNNNGCQASAIQTLKVLSACIIAVPSAFTPDNDGLNDYLYPLNALKAENLDFKVFNRWGQLLFHSTNWQQKWDGKVGGVMQGTGVYIWMLNFTHKDTRQKYSLKGTTTLIR